MNLRARLFLTSLAVALPLATALFFIDDRIRLTAMEESLRRAVAFDVATGLQDRCEIDPPRSGRPGRGGGPPPGRQGPGPGRFGPPPGGGFGPGSLDGAGRGPSEGRDGPGRGRGPAGGYEFFAYDAHGKPSSADAPPLPAQRDAGASTFWSGSGRGVELVVPLGDDGPCALVLARMPPPPGELRDRTVALALVVISVFSAAWFAAGPVISKLRRLEASVGRSAASHYAQPVAVEGRDEVAALAGSFNDAGRLVRAHLMEVAAREESLRAFVANTTHDVAIPLTVLQGHLAELDRQLTTSGGREHVRAAVQEAHYMTSLLRNLGAATKLDEGLAPIVVSPVDLSALAERVVARHRPISRALGVELNVAVPEPPLIVPSDHTLLEQALSNLVDNAIRYNHEGGHVAVLLDQAGDGFVLSVTDDGPGVTDEELTQLTTRWFRGSEARTRRPDGKGLGLAIVAESLKRLGLVLTFDRPAGVGLRARIGSAP